MISRTSFCVCRLYFVHIFKIIMMIIIIIIIIASTLSLQEDILLLCPCPPDTFLDQYLSTWSSSSGPPPVPLPGKQSFWDRPGVLADRAVIESSVVEPSQRARFLAAQAPHSGDWLLALPIANCGLRLDDEAVRVAVGMPVSYTHLTLPTIYSV